MELSVQEMEAELSSIKNNDESKVDALNRNSFQLMESAPDKALQYASDAHIISERLNYKKGLASSLFNLGFYYCESGEFEKALEKFHPSLLIRKELKDEKGIAAVYKNIGNVYLYQGNYSEALDNYNEAIDIGLKSKDEKGTADLFTNTGIIHYFQGNYILSLQSHLKALDTYKKLDEKERIATSYTNIGTIYLEQKNYQEALGMFQKALAIRMESNDQKSMGDIYNNIGNVYQELGNYGEALKHHSLTLSIREKLNDKSGIAYSFNNLGNVYTILGDTKLAWEYYEQSLERRTELGDKRGMAESHLNLGELFLRNNDYEKAETQLKSALNLALETGSKNVLRDCYLNLSSLSAVEKDYENAYRYYLQFSSTDKEITSADISRQLTQMALKNEMEQKERETEIEKEKNAELKKAYDSLDEEKKRSESLLLNILPEEVAEELKQKGSSEAKHYDLVTILFADIRNFTKISEILTPKELIHSLDTCFRQFDMIVEAHGVEKIKVIGDAYMCAGGIPVANKTNAEDVVRVAIEMQKFMKQYEEEQKKKNLPSFELRIGINSGPVVAGIVGLKKFAYDIWGDAVNIAARMESSGETGRVNISGNTYQLVRNKFHCIYRGKLEAKNKGLVDMYFVGEEI